LGIPLATRRSDERLLAEPPHRPALPGPPLPVPAQLPAAESDLLLLRVPETGARPDAHGDRRHARADPSRAGSDRDQHQTSQPAGILLAVGPLVLAAALHAWFATLGFERFRGHRVQFETILDIICYSVGAMLGTARSAPRTRRTSGRVTRRRGGVAKASLGSEREGGAARASHAPAGVTQTRGCGKDRSWQRTGFRVRRSRRGSGA